MVIETLAEFLTTVQKEWITPSLRYYAQDRDGTIHSFDSLPHRFSHESDFWKGDDKRKLTTIPRLIGWHHDVVQFGGTVATKIQAGAVIDGPVPVKYASNKSEALSAAYSERKFTGLPADVDYARIYAAKAANAEERNIKFDMNFADFAAIVSNKICCITGNTLDHTSDRFGETRFSLDRIDPTLGYVKGNVVVMSAHVNNAKADLDKFLSSGLPDEHLLKVIYKVEHVLRKRIKKKEEAEAAVSQEQKQRDDAFKLRYGILPTSKQRG